MAALESQVQSDVLKRLRKLGCYVYKNAQNMYTEKGRPDLTACVPVKFCNLCRVQDVSIEDAECKSTCDDIIGVFVGIELKRPGRLNGVSEAQEVVGRAIMKAGGIWILSDSADYIENYIKKLQDGVL